MSIVVRALGITVIVMMTVLAIRLLNEREQLKHDLKVVRDLARKSEEEVLGDLIIWKLKVGGSRRKIKHGEIGLGLMMLLSLIGFLMMRTHANEYFFVIGVGISVIIFLSSMYVWRRITIETTPIHVKSPAANKFFSEFIDAVLKADFDDDDESKKDDQNK
ncbi:hypothetical protein [Limosilactobacillus allomucosae]|uniref:hypothetical protein n=1 Tax=Limosilactobacillus allomucosae TaxID=3142938 RepID=UPI0032667D4F